MRLDNMILTDFAAAIISQPNANGEQTTRATVISVDENDDKLVTIRIDGSNEDTAATTTVKCEADDRVMVLLKGHKATVIGNISSPVLKKVTANDIVAGAVTADAITTQNIESDNENSWINFHLGTFNFGEKLIWDGSDLTVRGTLTAGSGSKIGPWNISNNSIWYGATEAYGTADRLYFGTSGLSLGSTFKVSPAGVLSATGASISGTLTAGANSKIGGWDIGASTIYSGTKGANTALVTLTSGSDSSITIESNTSTATLGRAGITFRNNSDPNRTYSGIAWNGIVTSLHDNDGNHEAVLYPTYLRVGYPSSTNKTFIREGTGTFSGNVSAATFTEGGTTLAQKYAPINLNYVRDSANNNANITFSYASAGLNYADYTWLAAWNGYQLRAVHKSQFLASTGGTLSGGLTVSAGSVNVQNGNVRAAGASDVHCYAENTTSKCYISCRSQSDGAHGLYSNGYWNGSAFVNDGRYLIRRNTSNNTIVPSELYTYNEGYTSFRPVVGTNAGTNAVGVIVSNSASFGIYGRWAGGASANMSGRTISCPSSDIRLKKNIKDSEADALSVINAIRMRQFDWKDPSRGHWDCGMIVDEMEKDIDPKFCIGGEDEEDGTISYKSVDTFYLQGYEVKAIQELSARVEELERRLNE